MSESSLSDLAKRIAETELSISSDAIGATTIESALATRIRLLNTSEGEYYNILSSSVDEKAAYCQHLLISESWFLREMEPISAACNQLRHRVKQIAILSVPCARGEEAISALFIALQNGFALEEVFVEGYDAAKDAIALGRSYAFSPFSFRNHDLRLEYDFFEKIENRYVLKSQFRSNVELHQANLLSADWSPSRSKYDLILCRNLLIYLTPEGQRRLIERLFQYLSPDGFLIAASSEAPLLSAMHYRHAKASPFLFQNSKKQSTLSLPVIHGRSSFQAGKKTAKAPQTKKKQNAIQARVTVPHNSQNPIAEIKALADRGLIEDAFSAALQQLDITPHDAEILFLLGLICSSSGQTTEAQMWMQKTIERNPAHEEANLYLKLLNKGDSI